MTNEQAALAVLRYFNHDPSQAHAAGEAAYAGFCRSWEVAYPGEYIQRARLAGGVQFHFQED